MNLLGLVFSLLLILSYAFYACWDQQFVSRHLQKAYVEHQTAHRKIINEYQSQVYKQWKRKGTKQKQPGAQKKVRSSSSKKTTHQSSEEVGPNRECSKINLWPLIQEGKTAHPLLYEITAKLIRTFYPSLYSQKGFEYRFLDLLLHSAKQSGQNEGPLALEKISFKEASLQKIYYQMLKGTKEWDLQSAVGYPPLLDYVKADPSSTKICLFHAHPDLLTTLFNVSIGEKLYQEIHRKEGPYLTADLIERICAEQALIALDPHLFQLLELGRPNHEETKKTLIAKEGQITLRKQVFFKS